MTALYKGYSSYNYQTHNSFLLTDIELVKMNLLNHIYTRRGERVMMSSFGTRIPDLVFEPLDQFTLDILDTDLRSVISFDPRVELLNFVITPLYDQNTVVASIRLLFVELMMTSSMDLHILYEQA